jgi:hypothetical protein
LSHLSAINLLFLPYCVCPFFCCCFPLCSPSLVYGSSQSDGWPLPLLWDLQQNLFW